MAPPRRYPGGCAAVSQSKGEKWTWRMRLPPFLGWVKFRPGRIFGAHLPAHVQGGPAVGIAAMRQGLAALQVTGARIERPMFLALLAEGYGVATDPAA